MGKMIKLSPKSRRKLIAVFLVVFVLFCVFAVNNSIYFQKENEKPMLKYAQDGSYIEYKGRIYKSFGFNSHSYEFTTYKKLAKVDAFISIYSLINDEEENFLYTSNWQDSQIYTCIDDFEEKYPFGEYKEERVTGVKLRCDIGLEGYEDYFSTDEKFIDFILNIKDYSNGTPASHPLKASSGFTTDIFIYEDNLSFIRM